MFSLNSTLSVDIVDSKAGAESTARVRVRVRVRVSLQRARATGRCGRFTTAVMDNTAS